jgi:hypothetical protein
VLAEVNQCLALVALLREESLEKQGLIDYNFRVFRQVSCVYFVARWQQLMPP